MFKKKKYLLIEDSLDRFASIAHSMMQINRRLDKIDADIMVLKEKVESLEVETVPDPIQTDPRDRYITKDGLFSMKKFRGELPERKDED